MEENLSHLIIVKDKGHMRLKASWQGIWSQYSASNTESQALARSFVQGWVLRVNFFRRLLSVEKFVYKSLLATNTPRPRASHEIYILEVH
jgi:hypothetical protein